MGHKILAINNLEDDDDDDEDVDDDDEVDEVERIVGMTPTPKPDNPLEAAYLVKRMSTASNSLASRKFKKCLHGNNFDLSSENNNMSKFASNNKKSGGREATMDFISNSSLLSLMVLTLLFFLLCSSLYLVLRVNDLQTQVLICRLLPNISFATFLAKIIS